ncbi:DinB family protein [Brevibacillus composti]|uniref:DinB family protein n=1 Tax=Brevibacillus composti TaxID=2796470 RepID=A0A7T5ENK3_9BACL|nr:DinB family protein [Brevibacillus composti]QQE75863.1 DinB family protein [Brevibacillus composti]QUO42889.1 DinB family protein [Brevibacillus composti]
MDYGFVWQQYELIRGLTLSGMQEISEAQADIVPEGFSNNLRWNLGHILLSQDALLYGPTGIKVPSSYGALFSPGTKPADWQGEVPSLETLSQQLQEQTARIKNDFADRLQEKLPTPFSLRGKAQIDTFGEMLLFTLYHEGMHSGIMSQLKKAVNRQA